MKAPFHFGSKSATLARIDRHLRVGRVCEQMEISLAEWCAGADAVCARIVTAFAPQQLAIRSSAVGEDGWAASFAGVFESRINVPSALDAMSEAIASVFASYGSDDPRHAVLVQPMVRDIQISGVVATRVLDSGSPYLVINYDDTTGRSDTVTSGVESKTIMVRRNHEGAVRSSRIRKLISVVRELEDITGCDALDIEFCITVDEHVYVLQVRPIAASRIWPVVDFGRLENTIAAAKARIAECIIRQPGLAGEASVFGNMPDWNPAEMVGALPRPLAISLYEELITNGVWARARAAMGYRDLGARPLMQRFCGRPYVDVRLSLNSFLPADLPDGCANDLVNYQLDLLAKHREDHDKIEFNIAFSSLDFRHERRARELLAAGLPAPGVEALLAGISRVTRQAIGQHPGGLQLLLDRIGTEAAADATAPQGDSRAHAERLLVSCRQYGTFSFAILARHAFIGVAFLRSLVERGVLSAEEMLDFQCSIHTVASEFVRDRRALDHGRISVEAFLRRYGHLRPGTYDIQSKRYDEQPELYLAGDSESLLPIRSPFCLSAQHVRAIDRLLDEAGLGVDSQALFIYIDAAVRAREAAKFQFTRLVSDALLNISRWGQSIGLDDDALSYLPLATILSAAPDRVRLRELVAEAMEEYRCASYVAMPNLIFGPDDLDIVRLPLGHPTFITSDIIRGPVKLLAAGDAASDIDGCIVFAEKADPGFDWIFSHRILGLVTKFGGANSHMAIRCAEFALPAAIGCGERLFETMRRGAVVELNCAAQTIRIVTN